MLTSDRSYFLRETLEALTPDEQLFHLARQEGDARATILKDGHIRAAATMLGKRPDRFAALVELMAGGRL